MRSRLGIWLMLCVLGFSAITARAAFTLDGTVISAPGTFSFSGQDLTGWNGNDVITVTGYNCNSGFFDGDPAGNNTGWDLGSSWVGSIGVAVGNNTAVTTNPILGVYDLGSLYNLSTIEMIQEIGSGYWGYLGAEIRVSATSTDWVTATSVGSFGSGGVIWGNGGTKFTQSFTVNQNARYILVKFTSGVVADGRNGEKLDEMNIVATSLTTGTPVYTGTYTYSSAPIAVDPAAGDVDQTGPIDFTSSSVLGDTGTDYNAVCRSAAWSDEYGEIGTDGVSIVFDLGASYKIASVKTNHFIKSWWGVGPLNVYYSTDGSEYTLLGKDTRSQRATTTDVGWVSRAVYGSAAARYVKLQLHSIPYTYLVLSDVAINVVKAAAPVFNPAGPEISGATQVTISSTTSGAKIYYNINSTDAPTLATGIPYTIAVTVNPGDTLKAIAAFADGSGASDVTSVKYVPPLSKIDTVTWTFSKVQVKDGGSASWTSASPISTTGTYYDYTYAITKIEASMTTLAWTDVTNFFDSNYLSGSGSVTGTVPFDVIPSQTFGGRSGDYSASATVHAYIDSNGYLHVDVTNFDLNFLTYQYVRISGTVTANAYAQVSSVSPVLVALPGSVDVTSDAGTTSFAVSNAGSGSMGWSASVISGSGWVTITSGSSGTNAGTINVSYSENTTVNTTRTATIRITATGATGSPRDVMIVQEGAVNKTQIESRSGTLTTTPNGSLDYVLQNGSVHVNGNVYKNIILSGTVSNWTGYTDGNWYGTWAAISLLGSDYFVNRSVPATANESDTSVYAYTSGYTDVAHRWGFTANGALVFWKGAETQGCTAGFTAEDCYPDTTSTHRTAMTNNLLTDPTRFEYQIVYNLDAMTMTTKVRDVGDSVWDAIATVNLGLRSPASAGNDDFSDVVSSVQMSDNLAASSTSYGFNYTVKMAVVDMLSGDANCDGVVNVSDLSLLAANYGTTSGATWAMGDFTGDGTVNVSDLSLLAANYGSGSTTTLDYAQDYASVFGTTADDAAEISDASTADSEDTSSTICSSLGLSLIAGLTLMGLMIVKLEE